MLSQPTPCSYPLTSQSEYYTIAARGPMLDKVYSMRYRSYTAEKYIDENISQKFMDQYDSMPNCTSYLMSKNKKAIASIRACIYDPQKNYSVPCMEIFKKEIEDSIGLNDIFVEVNKFTVEPGFQSKAGRQARLLLFSTIVGETFGNKAKNVVIAVRPEHVRFYRMFSCEPISGVKKYPHLNFSTILLACKDLESAKNLILSRSKNVSNLNESVSNYRTY